MHLAGEDVAQRWSDDAKAEILASREKGTRNLVTGIFAAEPRPPRAHRRVGVGLLRPARRRARRRDAPAGQRLAGGGLRALGARRPTRRSSACASSKVRTGIVLDADGGALAKMLPPFKAGVGGPIGGGKQYMPWIHLDDLVGIYLAAIDTTRLRGPDQRLGARAR